MATIDIKLKTYDQLIFEITKLNTDIYLKDMEIARLNKIIDELEKWLNKNLPIREQQDLQIVMDKLKELKEEDNKDE